MLNHTSFIKEAEKMLKSTPVSEHCFLFFVDIAEFQLINRYYGIARGDDLLLAMENLFGSIPEIVLFERILSDQFLFLLITKEPMDNEEIKSFYNSFMKDFLDEQKKNYPAYNVKISCGIYVMTTDNFVDAIDGANLARKTAKKRGSIAPVIFNQTILDGFLCSHNEEQINNLALQEKRFDFFLQPKVNLLTSEIIGAEALARRIDENGDFIPPNNFLPIMEANGSVVELDILIYEQVCIYLSDRLEKGFPVVRTSVNLSRLHIHDPETAVHLHSIAQKYNVPPQLIEFELTETILLDEFEGAKKLIDQLRSYQYLVSIDDFGSGYAGINIWQELSFDTLKLDRKFLSNELYIKSRNIAIVPNVINIAQRLDIDVICEGVETAEQCEYLLQLGCTTVQGYFFSRPVPKEEFYETYEKLQGHYQSLFKSKKVPPDYYKNNPAKETKKHEKRFQHLLLVIACSAFLTACVVFVFNAYQHFVTNTFRTSIENNLDSYSSRQLSAVNARINDITTTMSAFAALIAERNDTDFVHTYISVLSENNPDSVFLYFSQKEFEAQLAQEGVKPIDIEYFQRLKNGEIVLSDISFSKNMGNIYTFSIGVPVFINDEFAGGLRAIVNADILTFVDQYLSPYCDVVEASIVDGEGTILVPSGRNGISAGSNIFQNITSFHVPDDVLTKLQQALSSSEPTESFSIGSINGKPYYLSVIDLAHNGWKSVMLFQAEKAESIIQRLFRYSIVCSAIMIFVILIVLLTILAFIHRWKEKANSDANRYLLLEQFSDTVLFDYDCKKDIIRFTPNASQLFQVTQWTQRDFLAYLSLSSNIYPADHDTIRKVLTGTMHNERYEVRIRVRHPQDERYYWCLIQYKYIFNEEKLASVIGKMVDIDEQQKREAYLMELSHV